MKAEKYRRESEFTYTLGTALTVELLKNAADRATGIFLHPDFSDGEVKNYILNKCVALGIEVITGERAFNILSQKENCFAIGQFRKNEGQISPENTHIVLVNPSNAGNLGTIIRTASGFGLPDIAIITPAVDFCDPKTVRASMGAFFSVEIEQFSSFDSYAEKFGNRTFYPFMLNASHSLFDMEFDSPCSLIFGNEATGLPDFFDSFEHGVIINHGKTIDSLNLPVAASIAMYEFTKYRWADR